MKKQLSVNRIFNKISSAKYISLPVVVLFFLALSVALPGSFSNEVLYADGQRYIFNGLLVHDLIRDGALFNIYDYAKSYYAHYPAFNLPYGPPFFAANFALAFSLFGISFVTARLVIVTYTILAALAGWQLFTLVDADRRKAFTACVILLFNPLTLIFSRDIATELPVIFFSLASLHVGFQYLVNRKKGYALATALLLGLGYLTKQHIVPLGFGFLLFILLRRDLSILKQMETIKAVILLILLTVPYTILSFKFSGEDLGVKLMPPLSLDLLVGYFHAALRYIPVELCLSAIGLGIGLKKQDKFCLLCLCWIICWYVFFTFVFGYYIGAPRYILIIIPALVYPASIAINFLLSTVNNKINTVVYLFLLVIYIACNFYTAPVYHLKGYSTAGEYVCSQPSVKSVAYSGHYDGNFLFGIRKSCPDATPFMLRSDQWLANRLWWGELKTNDSVKSQGEIYELFKKYNVGYVVIERGNKETELYQEKINLLQMVSSNSGFNLIENIPISSNYFENSENRSLEIYKTPFHDSPKYTMERIPIRPSAKLSH